MKRILLILLSIISIKASAQDPLDTAKVATLSMKGKEWVMAIKSYKKQPLDSTWFSRIEIIRDSVNAKAGRIPGAREVKLESNIIVENVPVKICYEFYKDFIGAPWWWININGNNAIIKLNAIQHTIFTVLKNNYNSNITRDYGSRLTEAITQEYKSQ
jgi:hypothetical protein